MFAWVLNTPLLSEDSLNVLFLENILRPLLNECAKLRALRALALACLTCIACPRVLRALRALHALFSELFLKF